MRIKCFLFEDDCFTEMPLNHYFKYGADYRLSPSRASYQLVMIADVIREKHINLDDIDVFLIYDSLRTIEREKNPAKKFRIEISLDHDLITTSDDIGKAEILDAELEDLVKKKVLRLLKNLFDEETKKPF